MEAVAWLSVLGWGGPREAAFTSPRPPSHGCRAIFSQFDPGFEAGSLDEAYLDVTDFCAANGLTGQQAGFWCGPSTPCCNLPVPTPLPAPQTCWCALLCL